MSISIGMSLALGAGGGGETPTYSVTIGSGPVITGTLMTATVNGLSGGETVTYQWTDDGVNITGATASTYTAAIGTDGVADKSLIRCVATVDGEDYTSNAREIRYAAGTAPAVADGQAFNVDSAITPIDGSASGANLTFSYALSGAPAGVVINSSTGEITGTPTAVSTGTATITATDQYGRTLTDTWTWGVTDVPAQVTGLSVTAGDTQNSLTWTAPDDGGAAITDYVIEVSTGGAFSTISDGTSTATSFTHTGLTNGTEYTYRVSAVNSVGTGTASATASGTPSATPVAPSVTASDSLAGRVLTITVDSLTGTPTPTTALTTLTLDGVDVSGDATGSGPWEYTVPDSGSSQTVAWTVTATNSAGTDTASGSEVVAGNLSAPVNTTLPAITGTFETGQTLSVSDGTWTGDPAPTFTYQWTRGGVDISGATSNTYTLVVADEGSVIDCDVTGTNSQGSATVSATGEDTAQAPSGGFDPATLFASSEAGAWYDPSDLTTMWTDTAGTTQATVGDAVARIDDKSGNGNHATQATVAHRPILRQTGALYYLEFDGAGDEITATTTAEIITEGCLALAAELNSTSSRSEFSWIQTGQLLMHPCFDNIRYFDAFSNSGGRLSESLASSNPGLAVFLGNATTTAREYRQNGVSEMSGGAPVPSSATVSQIKLTDTAQPMDVYGAIVVGRGLTAQEISDTEAYLAGKSGVTL